MRADMAKVIVERPRHRGWSGRKPKGYRKNLRRALQLESPPRREGMKRGWTGGAKALNEHLGPLRRYLDSQVGRPWDKVFAEICAHINRDSAVQDHVRDHVDDYVARDVVIIDGVPCYGTGGWWYGRPLHELGFIRWYVCPRSGLLRRAKRPKPRPCGVKPPVRPAYIRIGDAHVCKFFNSAWHVVTVRPLPPLLKRAGYDVVLQCSVGSMTEAQARKHYGSAVYAVAVRRLKRAELGQWPIPMAFW
jgi:hypothetical protein